MLRRVSTFARAGIPSAAAATVAQQKRHVFWFSNCSDVLQKIQQEKGYQHDLWIEEGERRWRRFDLKEGAQPHGARLNKQLELYNLDSVVVPAGVANALPTINDHSSFTTQKPYGETLKFELSNRAELHGYTSKWWITPASVRKHNFTLQTARASGHMVLIEANTSVFNASQLADPSQLMQLPISGGSRRVFQGEQRGQVNEVFLQHQKEHGFPTGVYFSSHQASLLTLNPAADAVPLETNFGPRKGMKADFIIYNASLLKNADEILADRHTAFASFLTPTGAGHPMKSESIRTAIEAAPAYPTNFWVSNVDLEKYNWELKEGAEAEGLNLNDVTKQSGNSNLQFFNVDQFADPAVARSMMGTLVR